MTKIMTFSAPMPHIGQMVQVPFPAGALTFLVSGLHGAQVTLRSPGGYEQDVLWRDVQKWLRQAKLQGLPA